MNGNVPACPGIPTNEPLEARLSPSNAPLPKVHGPPETTKVTPSETGLRETAYAAVIAAVVVATIYFGRPLLVPIALSVLMAFALAPVVEFLRRWRLGRIPGVILTVTLSMLVIASKIEMRRYKKPYS